MDYKVDEVFTFGQKELKCVKTDTPQSCAGCAFEQFIDCIVLDPFIGNCQKKEREDKTDVIFILNS